jgi:hypothetical protein
MSSTINLPVFLQLARSVHPICICNCRILSSLPSLPTAPQRQSAPYCPSCITNVSQNLDTRFPTFPHSANYSPTPHLRARLNTATCINACAFSIKPSRHAFLLVEECGEDGKVRGTLREDSRLHTWRWGWSHNICIACIYWWRAKSESTSSKQAKRSESLPDHAKS